MQTSNTLGFEPAVVQKASEEIVNQIQDSILAGKLKPGDSLPPERELIKMFARSRPTVREALRVLEMKGLISVTGGGGTLICKPETSQLEETLKIMLAMHDITPVSYTHLDVYKRQGCCERGGKGDDIPQKYKQGSGPWIIYMRNRIRRLSAKRSKRGLGKWKSVVVFHQGILGSFLNVVLILWSCRERNCSGWSRAKSLHYGADWINGT